MLVNVSPCCKPRDGCGGRRLNVGRRRRHEGGVGAMVIVVTTIGGFNLLNDWHEDEERYVMSARALD